MKNRSVVSRLSLKYQLILLLCIPLIIGIVIFSFLWFRAWKASITTNIGMFLQTKNLYYTIDKEKNIPALKDAVTVAIKNNAQTYLNPPIKNLAYKGIEKAGDIIIKWYDDSKNVQEEFGTTAMLMERAGTGGSIFRNIYRDFLKEAYELTGDKIIERGYLKFIRIASDWAEIISILEKISETQERSYVLEVSKRLKNIAREEKEAMELLYFSAI